MATISRNQVTQRPTGIPGMAPRPTVINPPTNIQVVPPRTSRAPMPVQRPAGTPGLAQRLGQTPQAAKINPLAGQPTQKPGYFPPPDYFPPITDPVPLPGLPWNPPGGELPPFEPIIDTMPVQPGGPGCVGKGGFLPGGPVPVIGQPIDWSPSTADMPYGPGGGPSIQGGPIYGPGPGQILPPQPFNPNPNPAQRFNGQLDLSGMMGPTGQSSLQSGQQGLQAGMTPQQQYNNYSNAVFGGNPNSAYTPNFNQGQQPPQNMAQMGANSSSGGGKSAGASNTGGSYGGGKSGR